MFSKLLALLGCMLITACTSPEIVGNRSDNSGELSRNTHHEYPPSDQSKVMVTSETDNKLLTFFFGADQNKPIFKAHQFLLSRHEKQYKAGGFYLNQYKNKLMLGSNVRQALKISAVNDTINNSSTVNNILNYHQYFNDVPIVGSAITLLMDKDYKLISISASLADLSSNTAQYSRFNISEKKALSVAWQDLTGKSIDENQFEVNEVLNKYHLINPLDLWQLSSSVQVNKVYFPRNKGIESAYQLTLRVAKESGKIRHVSYIISAKNGNMLHKKNLMKSLLRRTN